jgi:hypothetical protein
VTLLEAADILETAMHAGVPDLPNVAKLREGGLEVNDWPARGRAITEIWEAVDNGGSDQWLSAGARAVSSG